MAKSASPGEMRTRIIVKAPVCKPDTAGYRNQEYVNIYPDDRTIRCKWVSAYGTEAVQAQSLGLKDTATLTLRYDPRITGDCIIYRVGSDKPYEITSPPNDVMDRHRWLELRVTRRVGSK